MDRHHEITKYVTKEKKGIEIGPWFSPLAPKREDYQCLVLDIVDFATLQKKAHADPLIPQEKIANIEEVDLLGSSIDIENIAEKNSLLEKIDYIISSHNFEHLPNPIRFLQGCERVLKDGGMLSMAIPDLRTCFDYFRPHTTLSEWLEAYFTCRERPSFRQIFEQNSLHSQYHRNGEMTITFFLEDHPINITSAKTLRESFESWKSSLLNQETTYHDVHCSTFTPASFELLILDLNFLGLTKLQLIDISATNGCEFYVHLQRTTNENSMTTTDPDCFYEKRNKLLHRINSEKSINSLEVFQMKAEIKNAHAKIDEQQRDLARMSKESQERIQQLESLLDTFIIPFKKSSRILSPIRSILSWWRRLPQ